MKNNDKRVTDLCYHHADNAYLADELMIANMLNILNNPSLAQMLDDQELKSILTVIKNHVVNKAEIVLDEQQKYFNKNSRGR